MLVTRMSDIYFVNHAGAMCEEKKMQYLDHHKLTCILSAIHKCACDWQAQLNMKAWRSSSRDNWKSFAHMKYKCDIYNSVNQLL